MIDEIVRPRASNAGMLSGTRTAWRTRRVSPIRAGCGPYGQIMFELVERGQKDVVPKLIALTRNTAVDEVGTNGGAFHALWTLHGLGELTSTTSDAFRAAVDALKHPAAGVRKAAAMVLPRDPASTAALIASGALADPDHGAEGGS